MRNQSDLERIASIHDQLRIEMSEEAAALNEKLDTTRKQFPCINFEVTPEVSDVLKERRLLEKRMRGLKV